MAKEPNTIRPTDNEARALARSLLAQARFAALAVNHDKAPYVSRIAVVCEGSTVLILVSTLSLHTRALEADSTCSLLVGEPEDKGDPLTHPRMTLVGHASKVSKQDFRDLWLSKIPKSKLYFDFADFIMFRITPEKIHLYGGFGKAFELTPTDLNPL